MNHKNRSYISLIISIIAANGLYFSLTGWNNSDDNSLLFGIIAFISFGAILFSFINISLLTENTPENITHKQQDLDIEAYYKKQEKKLKREAEEERNNVIQKMAQEIEKQMNLSVKDVMDQASKMSSLADGMKDSSEIVTQHAAENGISADESNRTAQTVSAAVEELAVSTNTITQQIQTSRQISEEAVDANNHTKQTISALAETVSQISEVIELIDEIAAQTNLLALNATIEAARAGEAGKGFAVVANEVKSLSAQTSKATDTIAQHISNVKAETDKAVLAVEEINKAIIRVDEIGVEVAHSIDQQKVATDEISESVGQSAQLAKSVSLRTEDVANEAKASLSKADDLQNTITNLNTDISKLTTELKRILDAAGKTTVGRNNKRYKVSLPAIVTIEGRNIHVTITNLANNGVLLTSKEAFKKDEEGQIKINKISSTLPFRVRGFNKDGSIRASFDDLTAQEIRNIDRDIQENIL